MARGYSVEPKESGETIEELMVIDDAEETEEEDLNYEPYEEDLQDVEETPEK